MAAACADEAARQGRFSSPAGVAAVCHMRRPLTAFHGPVTVLPLQTSSERIPWSDIPALLGVLLVCWVAAGAWNGDYSPSGEPGAYGIRQHAS